MAAVAECSNAIHFRSPASISSVTTAALACSTANARSAGLGFETPSTILMRERMASVWAEIGTRGLVMRAPQIDRHSRDVSGASQPHCERDARRRMLDGISGKVRAAFLSRRKFRHDSCERS